MAVKLVSTREAESDLNDACAWYEDQREGLGAEFLKAVDACIKSICQMPMMYQVIHQHCRRATLLRFPYAVYYGIEDDLVTIYAVIHTSRHPREWRKRLR